MRAPSSSSTRSCGVSSSSLTSGSISGRSRTRAGSTRASCAGTGGRPPSRPRSPSAPSVPAADRPRKRRRGKGSWPAADIEPPPRVCLAGPSGARHGPRCDPAPPAASHHDGCPVTTCRGPGERGGSIGAGSTIEDGRQRSCSADGSLVVRLGRGPPLQDEGASMSDTNAANPRWWWTAAAIVASLAVASACAPKTARRQTDIMEQTHKVSVTANVLRVRVNDLVERFAGRIEDTADRIGAETDDDALRRRALALKVDAIPAVYAAGFRADPLAAAVDVWAFAFQFRQYVETGAGRNAF